MFARRKEALVEHLPDPHEKARADYARIRTRLAEIDAEIRQIDHDAWAAGNDDNLHAAALAMVDGGLVPLLSATAAERRAALVRERDVTTRALTIAKDRFHKEEKRRQRAAARELAPEHRAAVRDVAGALRLLSAALDRERACHDRVGGQATGVLPHCGFPSVGSLTKHDSPVSVWFRQLAKIGYAAELLEGRE